MNGVKQYFILHCLSIPSKWRDRVVVISYGEVCSQLNKCNLLTMHHSAKSRPLSEHFSHQFYMKVSIPIWICDFQSSIKTTLFYLPYLWYHMRDQFALCYSCLDESWRPKLLVYTWSAAQALNGFVWTETQCRCFISHSSAVQQCPQMCLILFKVIGVMCWSNVWHTTLIFSTSIALHWLLVCIPDSGLLFGCLHTVFYCNRQVHVEAFRLW